MPTAFRPGRLNSIEILERLFPLQKRNVIELVLHGCNGDLTKAIEHFLSAQDTAAHQTAMATSTTSPIRHETRLPHSFLAAHLKNSMPKSAFSPLTPHSPFTSLHSAFSPRAAAFNTEALLGRAHPAHSRDELLPAHHAPPPYFNLAHLPPMPGGFVPPFMFTPYRQMVLDMTSQSIDRDRPTFNRSPVETDRSSESGDDRPDSKDSN